MRWAAVAAGVGCGLYWVGWHSSATTVTQIGVVAPKGIAAREVRLASGLTQADHVLGVDAAATELAIMSRLPAVGAVAVQRKFPHTINLVVTARRPLAALEMGKGFVLVDSKGIAFDRTSGPQGLPVIVARTETGRQAAILVLNSLPAKLRANVSRIKASTGDNVVLNMRDSSEVRFGSAADSALKVAVLAALMPVKAKVYDVTAPMMPTTDGSLASESPGS
jgi:cell division protein FtsQ